MEKFKIDMKSIEQMRINEIKSRFPTYDAAINQINHLEDALYALAPSPKKKKGRPKKQINWIRMAIDAVNATNKISGRPKSKKSITEMRDFVNKWENHKSQLAQILDKKSVTNNDLINFYVQKIGNKKNRSELQDFKKKIANKIKYYKDEIRKAEKLQIK